MSDTHLQNKQLLIKILKACSSFNILYSVAVLCVLCLCVKIRRSTTCTENNGFNSINFIKYHMFHVRAAGEVMTPLEDDPPVIKYLTLFQWILEFPVPSRNLMS